MEPEWCTIATFGRFPALIKFPIAKSQIAERNVGNRGGAAWVFSRLPSCQRSHGRCANPSNTWLSSACSPLSPRSPSSPSTAVVMVTVAEEVLRRTRPLRVLIYWLEVRDAGNDRGEHNSNGPTSHVLIHTSVSTFTRGESCLCLLQRVYDNVM